jgi:predicted O-methyltransferase YrrM
VSFHNIPGRLGDFVQNYDFVASRASGPLRIVEVGVALGKSLAYGASRLPTATLYAVDPWAGLDINGEQQAMAKDAGGCFQLFLKQMLDNCPDILERINVIRAPSLDAVEMFEHYSLDLVQLDALHTYDGVIEDIDVWCPKVKPGGVIGGDDFMPDFPGVEQAVRASFGDDFEVVGTNWKGWRHVVR